MNASLILHIFHKDLRQLRAAWAILILVFALATAYQCLDGLRPETLRRNVILAPIVLYLVWLEVIALLMWQEAPARDQAYWLTRPIPRLPLLCAKALSGLCFFVLPQVLSFVIILAAQGYSPFAHLPVLASGGINAGLTFVLGALLASLTRGHSQYWLGVLITFFGGAFLSEILGSGPSRPWQGFQAFLTLPFLLFAIPASLALLSWQYRQRRTTLIRSAFATLVVCSVSALALVPLSAAYPLLVATPPLTLRFDPAAPSTNLLHRDGIVLPLQIPGVSALPRLRTDATEIRFTPQGHETLTFKGHQTPAVVEQQGSLYLFLSLSQQAADRWLAGPGHLSAKLYLTADEPVEPQTFALRGSAIRPHDQRCRLTQEFDHSMLLCFSPVDAPEFLLTTREAGTGLPIERIRLASQSPTYRFFLEHLMSPVELRGSNTALWAEGRVLDVAQARIQRHFEADLEVSNLDLRRYLQKSK